MKKSLRSRPSGSQSLLSRVIRNLTSSVEADFPSGPLVARLLNTFSRLKPPAVAPFTIQRLTAILLGKRFWYAWECSTYHEHMKALRKLLIRSGNQHTLLEGTMHILRIPVLCGTADHHIEIDPVTLQAVYMEHETPMER